MATMRRRVAKAERDHKQAETERRSAERLLESQLAVIEKARQPRFKLPAGKPAKRKAGDFCRVIIPDTHGVHADPAALAACLRDIERLQPAEVMLMGDHLDCGGFLAQHHTMGYVAETEYSFEEDIEACNTFFDRLQEAAPQATFDYLEGNHEHRIEKWCVTESLRNKRDAAFLRRLVEPAAVLSLEKRGIRYHSLYKYHDGLPVQGAVKRGKCCFVHGISHSRHAADVTLGKFGGCVVFAHTHRVDAWVTTIVGAGTIGAWSFGCLCRLQPYYLHGKPSGWSHGYGVQLVRESGDFLTLQVPIISGESLLDPLVSRFAA